MRTRSAVATIKGYFYQFDYTIQSLLELENLDDTIIVEGIEDIDIHTASEETAVQCKYYEATDYNHSVIKKSIRFMLSHYANNLESSGSKIEYRLYGHFNNGQEKLDQPIDIRFLKRNLLAYEKCGHVYLPHDELGLSDEELEDFLSLLEIDINARGYRAQLDHVISLIKNKLDCEKGDAENFYYNNALRNIKDLAIEGDISKRELSKRRFLKIISTQEELFDNWFLKFKGEKEYFRYLKNRHFSNHNLSPYARFFLLQINEEDYSRQDLKDVILFISRKYSKIGKRVKEKYCPYFHIQGISKKELIEIKRELKKEGYNFIDGFDFNGADFNVRSILKQPDHHNEIKIKFINSVHNIESVLEAVPRTKRIFQFFNEKPFFEINDASIGQVDIKINNLKNIEEIV